MTVDEFKVDFPHSVIAAGSREGCLARSLGMGGQGTHTPGSRGNRFHKDIVDLGIDFD